MSCFAILILTIIIIAFLTLAHKGFCHKKRQKLILFRFLPYVKLQTAANSSTAFPNFTAYIIKIRRKPAIWRAFCLTNTVRPGEGLVLIIRYAPGNFKVNKMHHFPDWCVFLFSREDGGAFTRPTAAGRPWLSTVLCLRGHKLQNPAGARNEAPRAPRSGARAPAGGGRRAPAGRKHQLRGGGTPPERPEDPTGARPKARATAGSPRRGERDQRGQGRSEARSEPEGRGGRAQPRPQARQGGGAAALARRTGERGRGRQRARAATPDRAEAARRAAKGAGGSPPASTTALKPGGKPRAAPQGRGRRPAGGRGEEDGQSEPLSRRARPPRRAAPVSKLNTGAVLVVQELLLTFVLLVVLAIGCAGVLFPVHFAICAIAPAHIFFMLIFVKYKIFATVTCVYLCHRFPPPFSFYAVCRPRWLFRR